jgi:DNA processing protein
MDDLKYWVAFSRIPSIETVRMRMLESGFESIQAAWKATSSSLKAVGIEGSALRQITEHRPLIDPDAKMERMEKAVVRALTWNDSEYPSALKELYDPPPVLYLKGTFMEHDAHGVAVIGTRRATAYGREACAALVKDLASAGITIISGLAKGIDGIAHRTTLEAGGRTIAVMGSGIDVVYPSDHRALAQRISETGVLLSEYLLGTKPDARNFPRRNRMLRGLSLGVLVVEAPLDSGVMHTVRFALEQGRDVFAIPGSIFSPTSLGSNRLIQDRAKLVTDASRHGRNSTLPSWSNNHRFLVSAQ